VVWGGTIGVVGYNFVAEGRDQVFLMPPSITEWLPEDHLAFFVVDAVEQMDLTAFYAGYRSDGWGGAARHPRTMVALLLYAYCTGMVSSRQIERACHVDVAFRVVCGNVAPDHTTIARFRARHESALKSLFTASLRLCAKAGMVSVGLVALDGTKMAAPASMARNRSKDSIDKAVDEMFAHAKAADAAEDDVHGDDRGDEPPAVLRGRADRQRRFKAAKKRMDAELQAENKAHAAHLARRAADEEQRGSKLRGRKPKAPQDKAGHKPKKVNTTDPESGVMSTAKGFVQGYNAQAVANAEQVVVSAVVTDEHNDLGLLHPMIEATDKALSAAGIEQRPEKLLADAGYASEENFAALHDNEPECYVATRNMKKNPTPRTGRRGPLKKNATAVDRMDRKVSSTKGNALYRRRQQIIEPVFGQIKGARGIRGFSRRGKAAADSEWKLICGTHNLLKLYRRTLANPSAAPYSRIGAPATG
jgi:transposase